MDVNVIQDEWDGSQKDQLLTGPWTNFSLVSLEKEILRLIFLSLNENSCKPNVTFDEDSFGEIKRRWAHTDVM